MSWSASTRVTFPNPMCRKAPERRPMRPCDCKSRIGVGRACRFICDSGKGLRDRYSEVTIQFREPPFQLFPQPDRHEPEPNRLKIILQPDEGIKLSFQTKVPSIDGTTLQSRDLYFSYKENFGSLPEAYERLLLDALQGDASLFMRSDEIERSWEIIDPFIQGTESGNLQPEIYPIGSDGPAKADELLAQRGGSGGGSAEEPGMAHSIASLRPAEQQIHRGHRVEHSVNHHWPDQAARAQIQVSEADGQQHQRHRRRPHMRVHRGKQSGAGPNRPNLLCRTNAQMASKPVQVRQNVVEGNQRQEKGGGNEVRRGCA